MSWKDSQVKAALVAAIGAVIAGGLVLLGAKIRCVENETRDCTCRGRVEGEQVCSSGSWTPCACDEVGRLDAGWVPPLSQPPDAAAPAGTRDAEVDRGDATPPRPVRAASPPPPGDYRLEGHTIHVSEKGRYCYYYGQDEIALYSSRFKAWVEKNQDTKPCMAGVLDGACREYPRPQQAEMYEKDGLKQLTSSDIADSKMQLIGTIRHGLEKRFCDSKN